jgi:octaprenyl-diphosphate synthase
MKVNEDFAFELPEDIKVYLNQTLSKITSFTTEDFLIEELFRPSTHLLNRNGKLLRPTLLFMAAQAIGEKGSDYINLAAAIELLHVASLIHDDILDNGITRRGSSSVNSEYGSGAALLAGNALISKAIHLSSEYGKDVMDEVSSTALQMSAGELLDYQSKENGKRISIEEYIEIARLKTAALTGTASNITAVYKKSRAKSALYRYGFNLGIAFQIRDDMLDFMEPGSKDTKFGANIVTLLKEKYKNGKEDALKKATELNHQYIKQALTELNESETVKLLGIYTKLIEVSL